MDFVKSGIVVNVLAIRIKKKYIGPSRPSLVVHEIRNHFSPNVMLKEVNKGEASAHLSMISLMNHGSGSRAFTFLNNRMLYSITDTLFSAMNINRSSLIFCFFGHSITGEINPYLVKSRIRTGCSYTFLDRHGHDRSLPTISLFTKWEFFSLFMRDATV